MTFRSVRNFVISAILCCLIIPVAYAQQVQQSYIGYPINSSGGDAAATLSGIQHFGKLPTGALTAARTYTTGTATAICAQLAPLFNGQTATPGFSWDWYVVETSGAFTVTIAAGAGVTLVGTGTAATVSVRHFKWSVTTCVAGVQALELDSLETSAF
jgi:hypothetical protein